VLSRREVRNERGEEMKFYRPKFPDDHRLVRAIIFDHFARWFGGQYQDDHPYKWTNAGWMRESEGEWKQIPSGVTVMGWCYIQGEKK
jgi:hypothetical protein